MSTPFSGKRRKAAAADTGAAAEPLDARIQNVLLTAALVLVPLALLTAFLHLRFVGLTNPDAMDYAQLGRNLASGRGFSTLILRPLALNGTGDPLHQPDVTHGPLYPLVLALAFGAFGAKDLVAACVSGLFYVLTVPLLFFLGSRLFNRGVGMLAAAAFALNALMLSAAVSGLPLTFSVFLLTGLLTAISSVARGAPTLTNPRLPRGALAAAGLLAGALYLTDQIFVWILPVAAACVIRSVPVRRLQAAGWFTGPLLLLILPCMARWALLAGNPVFGLRGAELVMNTTANPGYMGYRMFPSELAGDATVFKGVLKKVALTGAQLLQSCPAIGTSWVLAFFVPALFVRFANPAVGRVRSVTLFAFAGLGLGMMLFAINGTLLLVLLPGMLLLSAPVLATTVEGLPLRRGAVPKVWAALSLLILYPVAAELTVTTRPQEDPGAAAASRLKDLAERTDVAFSDQPWSVAWYGERPAIWIPVSDANVETLRNRFAGARWLYLTPGARELSPAWGTLYSGFRQWNEAYLLAKRNNQPVSPVTIRTGEHPLQKALAGFQTVEPKRNLPGIVLARAEAAAPKTAAETPRLAKSR